MDYILVWHGVRFSVIIPTEAEKDVIFIILKILYDVVVIGWMLSTLVKSLFQKITEKELDV